MQKLFRFLKTFLIFRIVNSEKNRISGINSYRLWDDLEFIKKKFQKGLLEELDIHNPSSFNEKLQWLKLFYRDNQMPICADKYRVRQYVKKMGYSNILNEIYEVYENVSELNIDNLPKKFILKTTHGSGFNIVCTDKTKLNLYWTKLLLKSWLKQNLYVYGREWVYNEIKPKIIVEKFLSPENGELLDYKFWCINGIVEFIQVSKNENQLKINLYDKNWNFLPVQYYYQNFKMQLPKPKLLNEMVTIAEELSKPFPFARVDLYYFDDKIFFGEITFFPSSGFKAFQPKEFDIELGKKLKLPIPNNNLELLSKND